MGLFALGQVTATPALAGGNVTTFHYVAHCLTFCTGDFPHTGFLHNFNKNSSSFWGNGFYDIDQSYTWNISGNLFADRNDFGKDDMSFTMVYTGQQAGYTVRGTGEVDWRNHTASGTSTSSTGQTATWYATF